MLLLYRDASYGLTYSQGPARLQSPLSGSLPPTSHVLGNLHVVNHMLCSACLLRTPRRVTATTYAKVRIGFCRRRNGEVSCPPRTASMHATALLHRPAESVHERSQATAVCSAANQSVASNTETFAASPAHIILANHAVVAVQYEREYHCGAATNRRSRRFLSH